jgi:glycosyltransferase involved in cell wall biosynthesis
LQRILILDPDCTGITGHFHATTKSLLDDFQDAKRFVAVNRKASPQLDFGEDVRVWNWPNLRTTAGRLLRPFVRASRHRAKLKSRNVDAMLQFARSAELRQGDAIIAHSVFPWQAAGLAAFAFALRHNDGPRFHLRILDGRLRSQQTLEEQNGLQILADAARELPRLDIYTETIELASELEASYRFPHVKQWLIPMNYRKLDGFCDKPDLRDGFVIGLLGGKREEQGARQIPNLIRLLALRQLDTGLAPIRILCQKPTGLNLTGRSRDEAERFMRSLAELSPSPNVEIELLNAELSAAQFKQIIDRSHVLLLPYDIQRYGLRGSGLIIEAAMSGTPVVVSRGFAMRDWQQVAGSPAPPDLAGYVEGVIAVGRDYQRFRDGAIRAGQAMKGVMDERIAEIRYSRSKAKNQEG